MWKDVARNMDRDKALALVYGTSSAFMTAVHAVLVKSAVKTKAVNESGSPRVICPSHPWKRSEDFDFTDPCISDPNRPGSGSDESNHG